jgi:hypothetical protein
MSRRPSRSKSKKNAAKLSVSSEACPTVEEAPS